MNHTHKPDWDPATASFQKDQIGAYEDMRERCPVAFSAEQGWTVFRHADVTRILNDSASFSNVVSRNLSVPNGMDPPKHTEYRRIIDRYFTAGRIAAFEPACRAIITELLEAARSAGEVECIAEVALPFAARVQCAFLGWPAQIHIPLLRWAEQNHNAIRTQDRKAVVSVALAFERFIGERLEECRRAAPSPEHDITADLMQQKVDGRNLSHREIASILRNWTVGEIGTIAASVGILAHYFATHPELQEQCRTQPSVLSDAADEILRIDGPLVSNRRVTTCPVMLHGREIGANERVTINWIAANRDGRAIDDPESFRLGRAPGQNLLYGAGVHVCPGAPLARMELRVVLEVLLSRTVRIRLISSRPAIRAAYPASGFASLALLLE